MKRLSFFLLPLLIFVLAVGGIYFWWVENSKAVSADETLRDFVIPKGSAASVIGMQLFDQHLIKNALAFKIYVQVTGKSGQIKPGEYQLSANLSLPGIVAKLIKGPSELWVTVPEGLRREEIPGRFVESLGIKDSAGFTDQFLSLTEGKEGYLFPDTYLFPRDVTAQVAVNKMLTTFDKKVDAKMQADAAASGRILDEVITLASLVERETKTDAERPVVAGILLKRLEIGMPLQVDATIQYVLSSAQCLVPSASKCNWWPEVLLDDRKIKSPFNTYLNAGLPPSPIANPGLSSIKAAIYPADTSYLYYLHDKDGLIHYASSLEEHNRNIQKYIGS
jgi:UPF0755 protein